MKVFNLKFMWFYIVGLRFEEIVHGLFEGVVYRNVNSFALEHSEFEKYTEYFKI